MFGLIWSHPGLHRMISGSRLFVEILASSPSFWNMYGSWAELQNVNAQIFPKLACFCLIFGPPKLFTPGGQLFYCHIRDILQLWSGALLILGHPTLQTKFFSSKLVIFKHVAKGRQGSPRVANGRQGSSRSKGDPRDG